MAKVRRARETRRRPMVSKLATWPLIWDNARGKSQLGTLSNMNDTWREAKTRGDENTAHMPVGRTHNWRKSMSDHVAYALLIYTGLQIFVTVHALREGFPSILPYVALVVLVAGIIPACRWFERRWSGLSDEEAADPAWRPAFRRDAMLLWALAIGLPFFLTGFFKACFMVI